MAAPPRAPRSLLDVPSDIVRALAAYLTTVEILSVAGALRCTSRAAGRRGRELLTGVSSLDLTVQWSAWDPTAITVDELVARVAAGSLSLDGVRSVVFELPAFSEESFDGSMPWRPIVLELSGLVELSVMLPRQYGSDDVGYCSTAERYALSLLRDLLHRNRRTLRRVALRCPELPVFLDPRTDELSALRFALARCDALESLSIGSCLLALPELDFAHRYIDGRLLSPHLRSGCLNLTVQWTAGLDEVATNRQLVRCMARGVGMLLAQAAGAAASLCLQGLDVHEALESLLGVDITAYLHRGVEAATCGAQELTLRSCPSVLPRLPPLFATLAPSPPPLRRLRLEGDLDLLALLRVLRAAPALEELELWVETHQETRGADAAAELLQEMAGTTCSDLAAAIAAAGDGDDELAMEEAPGAGGSCGAAAPSAPPQSLSLPSLRALDVVFRRGLSIGLPAPWVSVELQAAFAALALVRVVHAPRLASLRLELVSDLCRLAGGPLPEILALFVGRHAALTTLALGTALFAPPAPRLTSRREASAMTTDAAAAVARFLCGLPRQHPLRSLRAIADAAQRPPMPLLPVLRAVWAGLSPEQRGGALLQVGWEGPRGVRPTDAAQLEAQAALPPGAPGREPCVALWDGCWHEQRG
jgi:hypothetical protein